MRLHHTTGQLKGHKGLFAPVQLINYKSSRPET